MNLYYHGNKPIKPKLSLYNNITKADNVYNIKILNPQHTPANNKHINYPTNTKIKRGFSSNFKDTLNNDKNIKKINKNYNYNSKDKSKSDINNKKRKSLLNYNYSNLSCKNEIDLKTNSNQKRTKKKIIDNFEQNSPYKEKYKLIRKKTNLKKDNINNNDFSFENSKDTIDINKYYNNNLNKIEKYYYLQTDMEKFESQNSELVEKKGFNEENQLQIKKVINFQFIKKLNEKRKFVIMQRIDYFQIVVDYNNKMNITYFDYEKTIKEKDTTINHLEKSLKELNVKINKISINYEEIIKKKISL